MDPVSLTLTIGPLILKAAAIVKQCRDIQSRVQSAPNTLASIISQCNGVNHVLLEVQNLGLQDMSYIDDQRRESFINEVDNISVGCTNTLAAIEKHIQNFESDAVIIGPMRKLGLKDKVKIASMEEDVQRLLQKLGGYQLTIANELLLIQIQMNRNTHQLVQMHGTALTKLLERSRTPREKSRLNQREQVQHNRFSIASSSNSTISDTSFDFDQIALDTSTYRHAFRKQVKDQLSQLLVLPPRDFNSSQLAVASLPDNDSFYQYPAEFSSEVGTINSGSAEIVRELNVRITSNEGFDDDFLPPRSEGSNTIDSPQEHTILDPTLQTALLSPPAGDSLGYVYPRHIDRPRNVEHNTHITIDPETGNFIGMPPEWSQILEENEVNSKTPQVETFIPPNEEPDPDFAPQEHEQDWQPATGGSLEYEMPAPLKVSKRSSTEKNHQKTRKSVSEPTPKRRRDIKLVVVGDNSTVKTSMLTCYTTNKPPGDYIPSVFDNYATPISINDVPYTIGLFDTASSEDYDRIRPLYYPQTDVFIIAASIDNISEYASAVHKWAPELQHHCPGIPMLLVGVKSPDKKGNAKGNFRLSDRKSLGKRIAKQIGAIGYFECDLTDLTGLKDVFDKAVIAALQLPMPKEEKKGSRWRAVAKSMGVIEEE